MANETALEKLQNLFCEIDPEVLSHVMPLTGGTITMMFTDIVDSTRLKAQMGDRPFFDNVLQPHNILIRETLSKHNGRELKTIGDAFLAAFPVAPEAVTCACEIQQRLSASPIHTEMGPLKIRIGLHTGAPKVYRDPVSKLIDLSGTDVDKAARVEGLARGEHVLISDETRSLAKPKDLHDWGVWVLKGLGRHRIFEVLWAGKKPERPAGHAWREPVRYLTRFYGRERDIIRIMNAVSNNHLVTLRGMGGIGKSRLADEIATRLGQQFDGAVHFAELADKQNSETAVVSELIRKLEVSTTNFPNEETALITALQDRSMLLVLDNFEVVMSATPFVAKLLRRCPGLYLLVTSQQLLSVPGEQQIEIEPMATPVAGPNLSMEILSEADSFKLFCDRVRLKTSHWTVDPAQVPLIAEILTLTDGIPLSIELAATWVDRIALAELAGGIKKTRAKYLAGAGVSVESQRHASMGACIDWSFNLLSEQERSLLIKLSVFVGGFFADCVAHICQEESATEILDALYRHSLIAHEERLGKTRYWMLPTVQDFVATRIGENRESLAQIHARHFLTVLQDADKQIEGHDYQKGIDRITADFENMQAGVEWALRTNDCQMIVNYSQVFFNYLRLTTRFVDQLDLQTKATRAAEAMSDLRLVAGCQVNLGNAYMSLPIGDRAHHLQSGIDCYSAALRTFTEEDLPLDWATTQNNLGNAFSNLSTSDRSRNLQSAIDCYSAALRVRTEKEFPRDWATIQINLGNAYAKLPTGDRVHSLQAAIDCHTAALRVFTRKDFPLDWAAAQNNLGSTYLILPSGDRASNLQLAIEYFLATLRIRTEKDLPVDWATTQNNLGNGYANLPTGDRVQNLQLAIDCYTAALRVRTEKNFPLDWATTQINLGSAYAELPNGDNDHNLRCAIECYSAALRTFTEKDFPLQWATIQNNLGSAHLKLSTGDRARNIESAIECLLAALRVRTEKDLPLDWAMSQNNLGIAFANLSTGDRVQNLHSAIECFSATLRVRTEEKFPLDWATTQINLGNAYLHLSTHVPMRNYIELAVNCFLSAIRGYEKCGLTERAETVKARVHSLQEKK
jgi:predicted ATPase/class 3 adenylate cyclase